MDFLLIFQTIHLFLPHYFWLLKITDELMTQKYALMVISRTGQLLQTYFLFNI